jgi:hypothetical protein
MEFLFQRMALAVILVAFGGTLIFLLSIWVGYRFVGRIFGFPTLLRWAILILSFVLPPLFLFTTALINDVEEERYLLLLIKAGVVVVILGLGVGQMFGGSKVSVQLDQKRNGDNGENGNGDDEEE